MRKPKWQTVSLPNSLHKTSLTEPSWWSSMRSHTLYLSILHRAKMKLISLNRNGRNKFSRYTSVKSLPARFHCGVLFLLTSTINLQGCPLNFKGLWANYLRLDFNSISQRTFALSQVTFQSIHKWEEVNVSLFLSQLLNREIRAQCPTVANG